MPVPVALHSNGDPVASCSDLHAVRIAAHAHSLGFQSLLHLSLAYVFIFLFSFVAGMSDVVSLVNYGSFTAGLTGSFVNMGLALAPREFAESEKYQKKGPWQSVVHPLCLILS